MPDNITKDSGKDLHTAITELVLNLKGDGTVSSIQKRTGVHRNMLTAIFEVYDAQMNGNEVKTKSKSNPRIKNLYWGTNSLITVADTLGIRVSELVRAAEDVQDGLPPWFERRISRDTATRSKDELEHVFLEAFGCLTYVDPFPAAEPKKKVRQYRKKDAPESSASTHKARCFSEEEVSNLIFYIDCLVEFPTLEDFVTAYCEGKLSSKDAFFVFKNAFDEVKLNSQGGKTADLIDRLRRWRADLVEAINKQYHLFTEDAQKSKRN